MPCKLAAARRRGLWSGGVVAWVDGVAVVGGGGGGVRGCMAGHIGEIKSVCQGGVGRGGDGVGLMVAGVENVPVDEGGGVRAVLVPRFRRCLLCGGTCDMYVCLDGWMDGWMHACMCLCIYIYTYLYTYTHRHTRTHTCTYAHAQAQDTNRQTHMYPHPTNVSPPHKHPRIRTDTHIHAHESLSHKHTHIHPSLHPSHRQRP